MCGEFLSLAPDTHHIHTRRHNLTEVGDRAAAWWWFIYDTPESHPYITAAERKYITSAIKSQQVRVTRLGRVRL